MAALGRLDVVAIDCTDPEPLVAFWCDVLGTTVRSRAADWIALEPVIPGGPHLAFQPVPEHKVGKNRLHLDLNVDDIAVATARAELLGAARLGDIVEEDDGRYQVMADPGGNEFCLVEWDEGSKDRA
ncbi:MAG: VOC family protein [Acidimicrobiia bacterium]|jgi:predicted enzyme related to lactoylglutathione lyase